MWDGRERSTGEHRTNRRLVRILLALALAACALFVLQAFRKAYRPEGFDLTCYLDAARALERGRSPYDLQGAFPYLYSPAFAWLAIPLSRLPYGFVVVTWSLASCAVLPYVVRRMGAERRSACAAVPLALAFLPFARVVQNNLANGQVNLLVLGTCVAFLAMLSPRRPVLAGGLLALAITSKLIPALLVLLCALRRDRRTIAWTATWLGLLSLAPALTLGLDRLIELTAQYGREVLSAGTTALPLDATASRQSHTLEGLLLSIRPELAAWPALRPACAAAIVAAVAALQLHLQRFGRDRDEFLRHVFALYLLGMLLILPMSETHHLAFAIPAVVLLALATRGPDGRLDPAQVSTFSVCVLGLSLGKVWPAGPLYFLGLSAAGAGVLRAAHLRPSPRCACAHGRGRLPRGGTGGDG